MSTLFPITNIAILSLIAICCISVLISEESEAQISEEHSPQVISSDQKVSITLWTTEPQSNKTFLITVISPSGSYSQSEVKLQSHSQSFANKVLFYPDDFTHSSTNAPGNYTLLIQEKTTGELIKTSSFQVQSIFIQAAQFSPQLVLAGAGSGVTVVYYFLAARKEKNKNLQKDKSEHFIKIASIYFKPINYGRSLIEEFKTEFESSKNYYKENKKLIYELKSTRNKEENTRCFLLLTRYLNARRSFYKELGYNFLDDICSEQLITAINLELSKKIRDIFGVGDAEKIYKISDHTTYHKLVKIINTTDDYDRLFDDFEQLLKKDSWFHILLLMKLFERQILYDINQFHRDWYSKKWRNRFQRPSSFKGDFNGNLKKVKDELDELKGIAKNIGLLKDFFDRQEN